MDAARLASGVSEAVRLVAALSGLLATAT